MSIMALLTLDRKNIINFLLSLQKVASHKIPLGSSVFPLYSDGQINPCNKIKQQNNEK